MSNNEIDIHKILTVLSFIGGMLFLCCRNISGFSREHICYWLLLMSSGLQVIFILFSLWLIAKKINEKRAYFVRLCYENMKRTKSIFIFLCSSIYFLGFFYSAEHGNLHFCALIFCALSFLLQYIIVLIYFVKN